MSLLLYPIKKAPEQGCISTMFAATAVQGTGLHITPPAMVEEGNGKEQGYGDGRPAHGPHHGHHCRRHQCKAARLPRDGALVTPPLIKCVCVLVA